MHILISIIIIAVILITLAGLYSIFKHKIDFFITGLDAKFNIMDLSLLWKVAQICELEQPNSLFFSLPALTKCMAQITSQAANDGSENDSKTQTLITKLFDFRTKLQNESDDKKGLNSTMFLDKGQKLRIIMPGRGVFASKILNNGKELIITVPRQKNMIILSAEEWVGKSISVYLWRKGDARYVFDTTVTGHGLFVGESSISLKHSNNLIRTQKRKAVRAKCEIRANLYIIKSAVTDYTAVETQNGYKCIIEDISESGALVRIGGKGVVNIQMKLQFNIQSVLIIMHGVVRTVEYNEELNQSLLHFECIHIEPNMKNEILSFVYNMLPEREKEVYEAIQMTNDDENADETEGIPDVETATEGDSVNLNTSENQIAAQNLSAVENSSKTNETIPTEDVLDI